MKRFGSLVFVLLALSSSAFARSPKALSLQIPSAVLSADETQPGGMDSLQSLCDEPENRAACMTLLFSYRCQQYAFPVVFAGVDCPGAASTYARILDMKKLEFEQKQPDGSTLVYKLNIVFSTKVEEAIANPKAQAFLAFLDTALPKAFRERSPLDLYSVALQYAGSDAVATEWLATLFQDTSFVKMPVRYLQQRAQERGTQIQSETRAVQALNRILDLLEPKVLNSVDYAKFLKLYPQSAKIDLEGQQNSSIYHFYPFAYAARRMSEEGEGDLYSFFLPFLMNMEYEARELPDSRWPMRHPKPFELTPERMWGMHDMYEGLTGALFGLDYLEDAPSFQEFAEDYSSAPFQTMRGYFWMYMF